MRLGRDTVVLPPRPTLDGQPAAKAASVASALLVAQRMAGGPAFAAFTARLPVDLRNLVDKPPIATAWVPFTLTIPLYEAVLDDLFAGDTDRMVELGRRQLREDLSTLYRMFIRIASPGAVAERAASLWSVYTRNAGTATAHMIDGRSGEVRFVDYPVVTQPIWHFARGSLIGVLELTRVRDLTVRIVDGGPGHHHCRYRMEWK